MKKRLIIFGVVLSALIVASFILTGFVKGVLINTVEKALDESVDAQIIWDHDKFSISFFQDFPSVTASLEDIGVINNAPFENDILFVTDAPHVSVDPWSLIASDIKINGISLENPIIHINGNEAGEANYDIAKETKSDQETQSQAPAP